MTILSKDEERMVDIGTSDTLRALYSTAYVLLKDKSKELGLGLEFLKTGNCSAELVKEAAKQLIIIKDELSSFKPEEAVYDYRNLKAKGPWQNNISDDVTSCADLITTADGKVLLTELIDTLIYASDNNVSVEALG